MSGYYVLDAAGQPLPAKSVEEWARWFEATSSDDAAGRRVARDRIDGGVEVSTVFLGMDHSFLLGAPLLFESMIFGGRYDSHLWRYSTRAEAVAGHARVLDALLASRDPEDDELAGGGAR
jgi:hypothetical protein